MDFASCPRLDFSHRLSKMLTLLVIKRAQLRVPLKSLGSIFLWCWRGVRWALNRAPIMLRNARFSDGCTPDCYRTFSRHFLCIASTTSMIGHRKLCTQRNETLCIFKLNLQLFIFRTHYLLPKLGRIPPLYKRNIQVDMANNLKPTLYLTIDYRQLHNFV